MHRLLLFLCIAVYKHCNLIHTLTLTLTNILHFYNKKTKTTKTLIITVSKKRVYQN